MDSKQRPPLTIEVICPDCGSIFDHLPHGNQKARSPEQNKRFHLMCALAYRNWPPDYPRQFVDTEDCRKWLTAKAGPEFREVRARIPVPEGMNQRQAKAFAEGVIRASGAYMYPQVEGREIVIYAARSIKFLLMGHMKFNFLNTLIQELIETEAKLDVEKLIKAHFEARKVEIATRMGRERAPKILEPKEF